MICTFILFLHNLLNYICDKLKFSKKGINKMLVEHFSYNGQNNICKLAKISEAALSEMDSFVCFCLLLSNLVQEQHEILILFFIAVFF